MAGIAHVITPDSASGAQVIDGSLRFNDDKKQFLKRTPSSVGNRRTFTFSCWTKRSELAAYPVLFSAGSATGDPGYLQLSFEINPLSVYIRHSAGTWTIPTSALFRDTSWYHIVMAVDTTAAASDRVKLYVNGAEQLISNQSSITENFEFLVNNNSVLHQVGAGKNSAGATSVWYDGHLSNVYFIDGQALGPESFGFTDPLTNTWKPKKYTGDFNVFPDIGMGGDSGQAIEVVINRQVDKAWIKKYGSSTYEGGGDPSDPSSAPSFNLPSGGSLYWFTTAYDTAHTMVIGSSSETGTQPEWASGGTTGSLTRDSATTVSGTPSSSYSSARTDALADNTVYAFTFTITTGAGGAHTGWFLSTSSSYSTGTPDEQTSGNTVGARFGGGGTGYFNYVKVYGTFATLNPNTNGQLSNRGVNSFYLPMDGNSPIGEDKSGQGNDFTPVGFGGSVELDKATGAKPILNTTQGGTQAGVGVFGSKQNVGYAVTVYNDGGGNKYYIDGVKQDTVTGLIRGATYTFDTSDSTVSSHPFRFSATSNGSHGGGSEYTNGVAAITGAATTITVPHDAPNTLYYYCTSHSGMGADITGITTNEKLADQYASNIVFASPLVGVKNDVCASIACTMTNKTVASNGMATTDATPTNEQSNFYAGSFEFDGTEDHLSSPAGSSGSSDLSFGTGDFTVECWVYQTSNAASNDGIFQISTNSGGLNPSNSNTISLQTHSNSRYRIYANDTATPMSTSVITDKWVHLAVVRDSGTTKLFVNGIQDATTISDSRNYSGTYLAIGGYFSESYLWVGYIQDFRVYKGVAKYTSDFVIPATNPDILPDTPSGVSGGSKLTKITDGAVSFDGSGDNLTIPWSTDFELGTGDFTIEYYGYSKNNGTAITWGADINNRFDLGSITTGTVRFFCRSSSSTFINIEADVATDKWAHIAAVREGTTFRLYVDGKLEASGTASNTMPNDSSNTLDIGRRRYASTGANPYKGFISNVRVIKGTALYTSNFTPSTAPLTNVTNTKLLCCQSVAEQQNNFIRMFLSDTLYTTKADILANATEVDDGESGISNKYWYIVPTGTEPIGSDVFTNDGSVTTPHGSNHFALYWRNGSSWTQTIGTYGPSEYSDFDYKSDDSSSTYSVYPARDFYVFGADASPSEPKLISGTLPTRAKYYKFDGAVKPGTITPNGDAAATNFNPFITDINAVRGQETGYANLNLLDKLSNVSLSNGNLTCTSGSNVEGVRSTIPFPRTGMWYVEYHMDTVTTNGYPVTGIANATKSLSAYAGSGTASVRPVGSGRNLGWVINSSDTPSGYMWTGFALSAGGDTMQIAFNADKGAYYMGVNNSWWGLSGSNAIRVSTTDMLNGTNSAYDVSGDDYFAWAVPYEGKCTLNYGQKPFKFPPPDGFQPLNAANVRSETVITRPDQYVGVTTYTGNGNTQSITDLNHKPDLVWLKARTAGGGSYTNHVMVDSVRGSNSYGYRNLYPNLTDNEYDPPNVSSSSVTSLNSNGFDIGGNANTNHNTATHVAWSWKAGGNKNTYNVDDVGYASAAAAGLDGGSLSVTSASVGTKQGFSIIKFTGTGVAGSLSHGLTQKPDFIIAKNIDGTANDWPVHHSSLTDGTYNLYLNGTAAASAATAIWPSASTDSVINVGSGAVINESAKSTILYSWHNVPGLQKFGSYEGNADNNGPYVELGFRPSILWVKNIDASGNWVVHDNQRNKFNPAGKVLKLDTDGQEDSSTSNYVDFLSNGFKIRNSQSKWNGSYTYIYCAWAEAPAVNLFGGGANAR